MEAALELLLKALEWSGKALYWVTIGPIIELIKLIFGIAYIYNEEGKVMEIIQRILEAYFEYVRFILEHIFWFIPK